jgi:hypothetical protein
MESTIGQKLVCERRGVENQGSPVKEVRQGVDAGYTGSALHPADGEGRKGRQGIDKTFTLEQVIDLARRMAEKPNILIKAGVNAKWYLKRFPLEALDGEIAKQQWRDTSRVTMYIIDNE